jgi:hypothetical protein
MKFSQKKNHDKELKYIEQKCNIYRYVEEYLWDGSLNTYVYILKFREPLGKGWTNNASK